MARSAKQVAAQRKATAASAAKRKLKSNKVGLPKPFKGGRAQLIGGVPHNQYGQKISAKEYVSLHKIDSRDRNHEALMRGVEPQMKLPSGKLGGSSMRKPKANLSNTYGIKNTSKGDMAGKRGAVTQSLKGVKAHGKTAKRKMLG